MHFAGIDLIPPQSLVFFTAKKFTTFRMIQLFRYAPNFLPALIAQNKFPLKLPPCQTLPRTIFTPATFQIAWLNIKKLFANIAFLFSLSPMPQ
jgi:hypothetical protein